MDCFICGKKMTEKQIDYHEKLIAYTETEIELNKLLKHFEEKFGVLHNATVEIRKFCNEFNKTKQNELHKLSVEGGDFLNLLEF